MVRLATVVALFVAIAFVATFAFLFLLVFVVFIGAMLAFVVLPSGLSLVLASMFVFVLVLLVKEFLVLANQIPPFSPSPTLNLIHVRDLTLATSMSS